MAHRAELILLDTHVWVWAIDRNPRLRSEYLNIINENLDRLAVSAASLWEVSMLRTKNRIDHESPLRQWLEWSTAGVGIVVLPINIEVAAEAYELPGTFHDDPADRLIVATARVQNCLLLTEDSKILDYPHVKTV